MWIFYSNGVSNNILEEIFTMASSDIDPGGGRNHPQTDSYAFRTRKSNFEELKQNVLDIILEKKSENKVNCFEWRNSCPYLWALGNQDQY